MKSKNIIKEKNLKTIINIIKDKKIATKAQLSKLSELSVVTVNSLIKTLIDQNIISEDEIIQPELGRPALSYRFNELSKLILIISMCEENNKDTVFYSIHNLYGEELESIKEQPKKITAEYFERQISGILQKYSAIKCIGFSIPGVEYNGKFIICDYPDLDRDFPSSIKEKMDVEVFFENDINMAILGYCTSHNITDGIGIYMPSKYPPGSGICVNGKIQKGKNGLAGEIQYLPPYIDWNTFNFSNENVEKFLIRTIKIFMCLYNPQSIVIYSEFENLNLKENLYAILKSENEKMMVPEIIKGQNLNRDIKNGIVNLALSKIM